MPSPVVTAAAGGLAFQLILSSIHEVPTIGFLKASAGLETLFLLGLVKSGTPALFSTFFQLNAVFIATWLVATAVRRLYFSPLRKFPGHKLAALSKLYEVYLNFQGRHSTEVRRLHREFGDIVRTGPNEISIDNVEAVQKLLARQRYDNRGPFYEIARTVDEYNILTIRNNTQHRIWRNIWEQAFRSKSLEEYRPRVEYHINRFVSVISENAGKPFNVVPIIANMAFDIMADLGFGRDTGMQDGKGDPTYMGYMHDYMRATAILGSLRNACDLLPYLPSDAETKEFKRKGKKMLADRLAMGKNRKDLFTHLLNEDVDSGVRFTQDQLAANTQLMIVAGAGMWCSLDSSPGNTNSLMDTTSSVIANILRELALQPEIQQKLYEELRSVGEPLNVDNTKKLPYLQAVIDEALRLWNPVPSGTQVVTGPEPVEVAGHIIPPRTTVRVQHLTLFTDERYFPNGEKFIPERWTDKSLEGVKEMRAFIPFSYGPHVCVGKQLALNELRLATGLTIEKFSVSPAPGYDDEEFRKEWKDYFAVRLGKLPLVFTPRE